MFFQDVLALVVTKGQELIVDGKFRVINIRPLVAKRNGILVAKDISMTLKTPVSYINR